MKHYEVHNLSSYGYDCGCISDVFNTFDEAINFIMAQSENPIRMDDWSVRDNDKFYRVICVWIPNEV